jgi:hypothetical protein
LLVSIDGAAHASSTTRPSFWPQIGLPDAANALAFDVSVEVELTMTFMVLIEGIFPVGGPVLIASLGAALDVDLLSDPWWRVDALTALKYGWSMPDITGAPEPPDEPRQLWRPRGRTIAQAHDAGPLDDVSTRWSRAFDIANGDDAGAMLPVGDELVVAEDDSGPWLTTLEGTGNPTWQQTDSRSLGHSGDGPHRAAASSWPACGSGDPRRTLRADGTAEWSRTSASPTPLRQSGRPSRRRRPGDHRRECPPRTMRWNDRRSSPSAMPATRSGSPR